MLEAALSEEPENEKVYLYLGIIYEQLDMHEKAVNILEIGLTTGSHYRNKMLFNLGNNYYVMGQKEKALSSYSQLIEEKGGYAVAYLNRANTYLALERHREAVDDYTAYLSLRPSAPQKEKIEELIDLIKQSIAEKERHKREEELRRQEEEKRRLEEERKRREEEERRKEEERRRQEEEQKRREEERKKQEALLREVMESLNNASDDTTSKSAEAEDIEEFEMELELQE